MSPAASWQLILVDTGSDVTACSWDYARGYDIAESKCRSTLTTVTGQPIPHHGHTQVHMFLRDDKDELHHAKFNFDVAEVQAPVMSMGKASDYGFGLWIPPFGGQAVIIRDSTVQITGGTQIPLIRKRNVYDMPTEIAPSSQGGKVVAPVHADVDGELFHEMLEPFDQDQEEMHHELDQQPAIVLARPSDAVGLERAQAGDGEPIPVELKQPSKICLLYTSPSPRDS